MSSKAQAFKEIFMLIDAYSEARRRALNTIRRSYRLTTVKVSDLLEKINNEPDSLFHLPVVSHLKGKTVLTDEEKSAILLQFVIESDNCKFLFEDFPLDYNNLVTLGKLMLPYDNLKVSIYIYSQSNSCADKNYLDNKVVDKFSLDNGRKYPFAGWDRSRVSTIVLCCNLGDNTRENPPSNETSSPNGKK